MLSVSRISIAPVKGLGLRHPNEVALERCGVAENRRFFLVDEDGRMLNLKRDGRFVQVGAETDAAGERLRLVFPDGIEIVGPVELGRAVTADFYGRPVEGRVAAGPWGDKLSAFGERPVRLVRAERPGAAVDRGHGAVSLVGDASVARLSEEAGEPVDVRRFRMLFSLAGGGAHEEDEWVGREVRIGDAVVRVLDRVGRCAITTQDPETGVANLDTLRILDGYRERCVEGIPFGVYGEVVRPGRVRVGDAVEPLA